MAHALRCLDRYTVSPTGTAGPPTAARELYMSLYTDYLAQIETRRGQGLHPKPIEDADLVEALIAQIVDTEHEHRTDSLHFFIYNTLPGTTSAAGVKAKFLKQIILGEAVVPEIPSSFAFELLSHMKGGPSIEVLLDLALGADAEEDAGLRAGGNRADADVDRPRIPDDGDGGRSAVASACSVHGDVCAGHVLHGDYERAVDGYHR